MCLSDFFKYKHCIFPNKYSILNTPNFIQYSKHKIQAVQGNPALIFGTFGVFRVSFYLKNFGCDYFGFFPMNINCKILRFHTNLTVPSFFSLMYFKVFLSFTAQNNLSNLHIFKQVVKRPANMDKTLRNLQIFTAKTQKTKKYCQKPGSVKVEPASKLSLRWLPTVWYSL